MDKRKQITLVFVHSRGLNGVLTRVVQIPAARCQAARLVEGQGRERVGGEAVEGGVDPRGWKQVVRGHTAAAGHEVQRLQRLLQRRHF